MHIYSCTLYKKKFCTLSHTLSHTFTHFNTIIIQFDNFSHFLHIGYQIVCTLAQNFIEDTFIHSFTHFYAILMQFLSHNCAILAIYVLISTFWATHSIYMNCKIHFKYFHTLFLTHSYPLIHLI